MDIDAASAHARQFSRHGADFEARVEPHPDHAEQFRTSFPDALLNIPVTDVSKGGVGLDCGVYLPKNLRVVLRMSGVAPLGGGPPRDLVINAVVRRCKLVDHKPTYQVGLQFSDSQGSDEQVLVKMATAPADKTDKAVAMGGAGVS